MDGTSWANNYLKSLDGLEYIEGLKKIDFNYQVKNLKDISALDLLKNTIQSVDLRGASVSALDGVKNCNLLNYLNLSNNCIYDTATMIDSEGNKTTYNNLEILANLNTLGALRKLYLSGNSGITNWEPLSNISNWTEKSGW